MRILHILDHSIPLHSGYSFRTLAILREQRSRGWETFHLTSPKQENCTVMEEDVDGWHFYRTPPGGGIFGSLPGLNQLELIGETTHRIEQVVKQVRPQILHAHSPVLNAIPALRVGKRLGIPVVYEVRAFWEDAAVDHGTTREGSLRYRLTRGLETWALKRAGAVTTICEGLRADIVARGVGEAKVTVIPNAVDVDHFPLIDGADMALKSQLGLGDATVIGFIGSFYAYEGLDTLINALPQMLEKVPNARLLLVGGGPQEAALKAQAARLGLAEKITFTGRVPHADVARYYSVADLMAFPRHKIRLTDLVTPLKPLEAMAQGKLVVASDVGGHRELIRDGETGILFPAGNPRACADAIARAVAMRESWGAIRAAGRRFVEEERNWKVSVARYAQVYESLAGNRS